MNQDRLVRLFEEEFKRCKLRADETAVVLSGEHSSTDYARAALQAITNLGAQGFELKVAPRSAQSLPDAQEGTYVGLTPLTGQTLAIATLKKADFIVDLMLLLHSPEQVEILKAGARILLVVEPVEMLESRPPTEDLRQQIESASDLLRGSRKLRVTSAAGTDIAMDLGQYPVITQYGYTDEAGRWDHWPSAFLYTWPNEGSAQGTIVLDKGDFLWPLNRYVQTPVKLTVKDGYIRQIEGEDDARLLREQMASFKDPEGYAMSHIGWGMDPRADWFALEKQPLSVGTDPRSLAGNVQFSTGPNTEAGGSRHTIAHFDMPARGCTLMLDERVVIRDGQVVGI